MSLAKTQQLLICLMDIADAESIPESYFKAHFPERYDKAMRFRFRDDRCRSLCAGTLLHEVLGLEETEIRYNEYGKPFSDSAAFFSLSHSGKYAVLAVGPSPIGIDIEQTEQDYLNLMPRIFTDEEVLYVGEDMKRFYILWTLKESLTKAIGVGLGMDMKELDVMPFLHGGIVACQGRRWYGQSRYVDGGRYIMSVVSETVERAESDITNTNYGTETYEMLRYPPVKW